LDWEATAVTALDQVVLSIRVAAFEPRIKHRGWKHRVIANRAIYC
jgi:hypothetical protein